jgi:hypothetical protein
MLVFLLCCLVLIHVCLKLIRLRAEIYLLVLLHPACHPLPVCLWFSDHLSSLNYLYLLRLFKEWSRVSWVYEGCGLVSNSLMVNLSPELKYVSSLYVIGEPFRIFKFRGFGAWLGHGTFPGCSNQGH